MGLSGFAAGLTAGYAIGDRLGNSLQEGLRRRGLEKAAEVNPETVETARMSETTPDVGGMVYDSDTGQYLPKYLDSATPSGMTDSGMSQNLSLDGQGAAPEGKVPTFNAAVTKHYRLGSVTQGQPFSDDQIEQYRLTKMGEVAARQGDPAKAIQYLSLADKRRETGNQREITSLLSGNVQPGLQRISAQNEPGADVPTDSGSGPSQIGHLQSVSQRVRDAYLRQGKVTEAKAWSDFAESEDGRSYANDYAAVQRLVSIGNYAAAVPAMNRLYDRFPDGQRAETEHLGNGQYRVTLVNKATGEATGSKIMPAADLSKQALYALSPTKMVEFMTQQNAKRTAEESALSRQLQLEEVRQRGQEFREDRRDERLAARLNAQLQREQLRGGLTPAQQRGNAEIDAARKAVDGLTPDEVRLRTTPTTASGRENRDFDPALARAAKLSARRKIGDDPWFDERQGQAPSFAGKPVDQMSDDQLDRMSRFAGPNGKAKLDVEVARRNLATMPGMAGHTLGQYVDGKGFLVLNPQGQPVSYLRRKAQ